MEKRKIFTLEEAWIGAMNEVLRSEKALHTEDYTELLNFQTEFSFENLHNLLQDPRILSDYREMRKVFFSNEPNAFGHNYADAIVCPLQSEKNPVSSIAALLKRNANTRKAALTFNPYGDEKVPCINVIQFLVREDRMNVIYFSRGQDIYRKFPCDAICIAELGNQVAQKAGLQKGIVRANITSAHIYDSDISSAKQYITNAHANRRRILTGNAQKYKDCMQILRQNHIELLVSDLNLPEIQSSSGVEVAKAKAQYAYERLGLPVWIDDTELLLEAYPLFPGPYTKTVFRQIGLEGIRSLLAGKSSRAQLVCRLCSFDGQEYQLVEGKNMGRLHFDRPIEDATMPLNSIFIGEGPMEHRKRAIMNLVRATGGEISAQNLP